MKKTRKSIYYIILFLIVLGACGREEKATEGIGLFEGMYLSQDNLILYMDADQYFVAENAVSEYLVYYEVADIIHNTGKELILDLYQEPVPSIGVEGGYSQETFYLSDDSETISTERDLEFERLNQEEIDAILDNLSGIKNILERNNS